MPEGAPLTGRLTAVQLADVLNVSAARIRTWVRLGLLHPGGVPIATARKHAGFGFAEVARARAVHRLTLAGVRPAKIRAALERVREWLPETEPSAAALEVGGEAAPVLVRLPGGGLAEPSGQLRFDFDEAASAVGRGSLRQLAERPADEWFELGVVAEQRGDFEAAVDAYERALLGGGPDPQIAFNLGNALFALERPGEAAQRYRQAVELDPGYAQAWNNLGNALAEHAQPRDALMAYARALTVDAAYADPHFNLAETHQQLGQLGAARKHWSAYLALDGDSPWAAMARERLASLPG
ncbi:MAG: tetratricopeptide repeat protein [Planctomycetota bacterium]